MIGRMILVLLLILMASPFFAQSAERLPAPLNTENYDEVAPVLSPDGKTLYFSRLGYPKMVRTLIHNGIDLSVTLSREEWKKKVGEIYSQLAGHKVSYPLRSVYNQDIWIAKLENEGVHSVELPQYPLNNALPNTVLSYWDRENELILLNQFFADGSMNEGLSRMSVDNKTKLPKPLHIYNFYTQGSDVQASISPSGDILILALEREDSHGNMDLYITFRAGKDIWSEPVNLGPQLNTEHRESTPFLSKNTRMLFFASDRPGGEGGMDIYVSERKGTKWDNWSQPKRLNSPINSHSDDSQPCFSSDNRFLYFTSMREGSSDIFRFPLNLKANDLLATDVGSNRLQLNISIEDEHTQELIAAKVRYQFISNPNEIYEVEATNGKCSFITATPDKIKFYVDKKGYEEASFIFNAAPLMSRGLEEVQLRFPLTKTKIQEVYAVGYEKLEEEMNFQKPSAQMFFVPDYKKNMLKEEESMVESYILDNIMFKKQTATIRTNSYPSLNQLVATLESDPDIKIIIEGHTDNGLEFGEKDINPAHRKRTLQILSEKRAEAVKTYLVRQGIESNRIRTVGFGDKYPLNDNSNKMERSLNRRVEIVIVD